MYKPDEFHLDKLGVTLLAHNVAYSWLTKSPHDINHLWIWHICDGSRQQIRPTIPDYYPRWVPTGVGLHTLVQEEPLTITASVYWPDCCGIHGFITDGQWIAVS